MPRVPDLLVLAGAALAAAGVALAASALGVLGRAAVPARAAASPSAAPSDTPAPLDAGVPPRSTFVAFARDFEGFRRWERHPVEGAMMPVLAAPGPSFVYASARAPEGARRWPVGTLLVKTIESGAPSQWTVHAMVKRGVPYNAHGATGWEFFELRLSDEDDSVSVVWRGPGPPSGHGYAAAGRDAGSEPIPLVCNDCHAAAWQDDGALTPALSLRR